MQLPVTLNAHAVLLPWTLSNKFFICSSTCVYWTYFSSRKGLGTCPGSGVWTVLHPPLSNEQADERLAVHVSHSSASGCRRVRSHTVRESTLVAHLGKVAIVH